MYSYFNEQQKAAIGISSIKRETPKGITKEYQNIGTPGFNPLQRKAVIQRQRAKNPHTGYSGEHNDWELTAHHIVPDSLLQEALDIIGADSINLLNRSQKDYLNGLMPEAERRRAQTEGPQVFNEYYKQHFEWAGGNLFYGPNTTIRPESGDKDDLDKDAQYIIGKKAYSKLEKIYQELKSNVSKYNEIGEEPTNAEKRKQAKKKVLETLQEFYRLTITKKPAAFNAKDWKEITTAQELNLLIGKRAHAVNYTYFKIRNDFVNNINIQCNAVILEGGQYKFRNPKNDSVMNLTGIIKGTDLYIKYDTRLTKYFFNQGIPLSTYIPKSLAKSYGIR